MTSKRALLLGAETELGAEAARALASAGHTLAVVASVSGAEAAFAVQRLARKTGAATSQAIDATNEMAVRVMVRQVAKQLGGLDLAVSCVHDPDATALFRRFAERELARAGGGVFADIVRDADFLADLT
jgi:NAD(P)-dependent dehydrogenase (short-subunit alcohol dehydrogenase family)